MNLEAYSPTYVPLAGAIAGAIAVLLALVALGVKGWGAVQRRSRRRAMAHIREQGAAGEELAEELLLRRGYRILGRQVVRHYAIALDGQLVDVELRADFLVARDRRRFVAEAKTGRFAPRLDTSATRRQLLEYRLMFDVQGVLLVDAEAARVHEVVFPLPAGTKRPRDVVSRFTWLVFGMALGATTATVVWPKVVSSLGPWPTWLVPSGLPGGRSVGHAP